MIGALVLGAVALIVFSALLAAAEAATFALGASRLRTLADEGFRGAAELAELRARPGPLRFSLRFLGSVANTLAAGLLVWAGVEAFGPWGGAGALAGAVVVVSGLAETAPRMIALRRPVRLALGLAPLMLVIERVLRVVLGPVRRVQDLIEEKDSEDGSTREERLVREISEIGQAEGVVGRDEQELVERAFKLDELTAWDVMVPRVDIFAWPEERTLAEIVPDLESVPFSRVPVYRGSVDDITGILYVREAYAAYVAGRRDVPLAKLSREPLFVPGSVSLTRLLAQFRARRMHMGIVADEFGGTDGLVTLEDILEELVGEIEADGGVDLREINHVFNVALPSVEHRSLNGFILEELGRVPEPGEAFRHGPVEVEIVEANDTQVLRARLRRVALGQDSGAPAAES
ncbi:MAG: HlyC/CorC family transporter [Gemmatimonadetes bacterium]|nr:MAG: HlyC/CorC family transporter [Gemmatimonadota bacterium]